MVKLFSVRRRLSPKEKLNILFCTYGSLTDCLRVKHGPCEVARQVKIAQPTVTMVLKRFAKYGYDVDRLMRGEKATGRPIKPIGNKAIEQDLLSQ